ncbi:potassium/sodium hyperpolarization-activated cyclic nucleotide-gated channel 4-like isoform X1 [Nasonia vitripennis]|uniref:Cyclic nucleotide-binding domain-containing protein n=1 Tax=Nasonia vitripennis TaxID=7425 RepID=A0A7M7LRL3_NASVI|nr:potassium/sodium hyperpolarization-activated cyclic nucleotide-gated channel 4-like isoform X1 [Nasonia vitripennis]XP_008212103.1 potassium/sodium hyperpolarization-activated cyclic nucleotide-gated channel 4-like isoform X1 [Nasonia vitripennis]
MLRVYDDCPTNVRKRDEILVSPEAGRFGRMLVFFRQFFMASYKSRSAQRYLRSHASIDYERRRHLRHYTHIIHPFSLFRHWWDTLMILTIAAGLIAFPYQAAFDMSRSDSLSWTVVKNTLILLCCCDIVINFLTGYYDKLQSIVELKPKVIAGMYMKKGFIFDFLGSFPTDLFFIHSWHQYVVAREVLSLSYVFRIFSFLTYTDKLARDYEVRRALYDFISTIFWLIIALHWQACLYWIVPIAVVSMTSPERPHNDSWINSVGLWDDSSDSNKYGHCILRAVATFMHSGFLVRTEPRTEEDQYLVIIFHFLGTLMFCFLIARVMQFFKGINSSKLKYQAALAHLSQYMSHKQLPRKTQNRIVDYYEFRFQRRFFREPEILSILSMHMRQEIRMHSCRKLVENVTFFNNLPLSLLARIVALLKSEIFLTNDLIVKANQTGDCMYFIATGTVAVYTLTGKEVCHLEDGAHFGEIALVMPDAKRVASVVAVETCKLYKLERADFARTIHPYPMLWERIKKIAIERHEKTTILNSQ